MDLRVVRSASRIQTRKTLSTVLLNWEVIQKEGLFVPEKL
jgi:hypothetical protein